MTAQRPPTEASAALPDVVPLEDRATLSELAGLGLSPLFDAFLPVFAEQTLLAGGEVLVPRETGPSGGLLMFDPVDRVGSIFAREATAAGGLAGARTPGEFFLEFPWTGPHLPFDVFRAELGAIALGPPVRHPIRLAREADWPFVTALASSLGGRSGPRWVDALRSTGESCFVAELDGRLIGCGWAGWVGHHGRVHSVVVHPRYRGLHVASDLLTARLRWLEEHGASSVVSEIARENVPSVRIALRAGMTVAGTMSLVHRPG